MRKPRFFAYASIGTRKKASAPRVAGVLAAICLKMSGRFGLKHRPLVPRAPTRQAGAVLAQRH
jgi:hypothetical protein